MKTLAILGAVPLLVMTALPVGATVHHVDPGESIQDAVDGAAPGDTVMVHQGEYHQSVEIETDSLTLMGESGTILDGSGLPDPGTFLGWHGIKIRANHITVKGLEICQYTGPGFGRGNAILSWSWPGDDAFSFNTVENCHMHDNRWGAVLVGNHGIRDNFAVPLLHEGWNIRDNVVDGHDWSSIALINGKDCSIEHNQVTGGEVGILVMACNIFEETGAFTSWGIEVADNTVSEATGNFGIGVALVAINPDINALPNYVPVPNAWAVLEDITVRDNRVDWTSGCLCSGGLCLAAVPVPDATDNVVRLAVVEENEVNDNTGYGIGLSHVDEATVSTNVVYDNGLSGITIVNGNDCRIERNDVTGGDAGILVSGCNSVEGSGPDTSGGIDVERNRVSGATGEFGIGVAVVAINPDTTFLPEDYVPVSGAWAVLEDIAVNRNWVRQSDGGTYGGGIVLGGVPVSGATDNVVERALVGDNDVRNNTGYGIAFLHVDRSRAVKNRLMQNTMDGIAIDLESQRNEVERNNVRGSDRHGISVMDYSGRNSIFRNTAFGSGQFDLYWDGTGTGNRWWANHYKTRNWLGSAAGGEGQMANLGRHAYSKGAYLANPLAIAAVAGALLPREERRPEDAPWGSPRLALALAQNSPNPCHQMTDIRFQMPAPAHATLRVYDISGRAVATLVDGKLPAGTYTVRWETDNAASGLYFYKLSAGGLTVTRKAVVLK